MRYKINSTGNMIEAEKSFMDAVYPNNYTAMPIVEPAVINAYDWLIDLSFLYDRLGTAKLDILMSVDAKVKAILTDWGTRHWMDLKRTDVATDLTYIASKVPTLTTALQTSALTTTVKTTENAALRKLFF